MLRQHALRIYVRKKMKHAQISRSNRSETNIFFIRKWDVILTIVLFIYSEGKLNVIKNELKHFDEKLY